MSHLVSEEITQERKTETAKRIWTLIPIVRRDAAIAGLQSLAAGLEAAGRASPIHSFTLILYKITHSCYDLS